MLQSVVLETANPVEFAIGEANPDELLLLTSVSGLDPADVTLFTGDFAREGGYYQGRRVGKRNPVFNFKINPDYKNDVDASDARALLYRQFLEPQAESDAVQVRFVDDRNPDRYLFCYTEKMPADIFTQKPIAQVSTLSVDPFLKSVDQTQMVNSNGWLSVPVNYDGTADTGVKATLKVVMPTTQVVLENNGAKMRLSKATPFAAGDVIEVSSVHGERYIRLNGQDAMGLLQSDSKWVYLAQSSNALRTYGSVASDGLVAITAYSFRAAWWGL